MDRNRIVCWILSIILVSAAAGCDDEKVGGCEQETTDIGIARSNAVEPPDALLIRINSVTHAGNDTYRQAALDLMEIIDSLEIQLCNCSELTRVIGPCWPPYYVRLAFDAGAAEDDEIFAKLLETPVAGRLPVAEDPDGYGTFWIEAGTLSRTEWVLWYGD